jgi:hypothetical protein
MLSRKIVKNPQGQIIDTEEYESDGSIRYKESIDYNVSGNVTRRRLWFGSVLRHKEESDYNSDNRKTAYRRYNGESIIYKEETDYAVDGSVSAKRVYKDGVTLFVENCVDEVCEDGCIITRTFDS